MLVANTRTHTQLLLSHNNLYFFSFLSCVYSSQSQCLHSSPKANCNPVRTGTGPRQLVDLSSHIRRSERLVQDIGRSCRLMAAAAASAPRFAMCLLCIVASILSHLIHLPDKYLMVVAYRETGSQVRDFASIVSWFQSIDLSHHILPVAISELPIGDQAMQFTAPLCP